MRISCVAGPSWPARRNRPPSRPPRRQPASSSVPTSPTRCSISLHPASVIVAGLAITLVFCTRSRCMRMAPAPAPSCGCALRHRGRRRRFHRQRRRQSLLVRRRAPACCRLAAAPLLAATRWASPMRRRSRIGPADRTDAARQLERVAPAMASRSGKVEGANPSGSMKDRMALSMVLGPNSAAVAAGRTRSGLHQRQHR